MAIPQTALPKYKTIRDLLVASFAKPVHPIPEDAHDSDVHIYKFADRSFGAFTIRATQRAIDNLMTTTSLTPAKFLFNGPDISTPLMHGINKDVKDYDKTISIMAFNPNRSLEDLLNKQGNRRTALKLAQHPEAIDQLFRTIVFVGLHDRSVQARGRDSLMHLDLNFNNIMRNEETGALSLIDQMSYEDVMDAQSDGRLNYTKANRSLHNIKEQLTDLIEEGKERGADPEAMAQLKDATQAALFKYNTILSHARFECENDAQSWNYLKTHLSDPEKQEWRGLEDSPTNSPAFRKTYSIRTTALNLDKATPQQLLDRLNDLHGASLARAR